MKRAHLLCTGAAAVEFEGLFVAIREIGLRVGWLDLDESPEPPAALEEAAGAGVFRAVSVGEGRVVTVKPVAGPPVLEDLLREHFAGCRLVVVRGAIDAAEIVPAEDVWTIRQKTGVERAWAATDLARALRKPRLPGVRAAGWIG